MNSFNARKTAFVSLVIITPVGFLSKFYSGPAADWVNNSLCGLFYEIFWCLIALLFVPRCRPLLIAVSVLAGTCILEFLQLLHLPLLEILRSSFIGKTIFGTTFAWSDFPYYFVGSGIGWYWMKMVQKEIG